MLVTFAKVAAPVLPFIAEELYQRLVRDLDETAPQSVHHNDYPVADRTIIETDLEVAMATVRTVVTLGHGLRKKHEIKVRQPLAELTVITRDAAVAAAIESHESLIAEELNVAKVTIDAEEDHLVHLSAQANFKVLGPRLGAGTKEVAAAIATLPHDAISAVLDGQTIDVAGTSIGSEDIVVRREPRDGLVVAAESQLSVALDTTVTPELAREGTAREIVSSVQGLRRKIGLEVSDRIALSWQSTATDLVAAFNSHSDLIAGEILATEVERSTERQDVSLEINSQQLSVSIRRS